MIENTIQLLLAEIANTTVTTTDNVFTFTRNDIPFTVTYSGIVLTFTTPKLTTEFTLNDCKDEDALANTIITHIIQHLQA